MSSTTDSYDGPCCGGCAAIRVPLTRDIYGYEAEWLCEECSAYPACFTCHIHCQLGEPPCPKHHKYVESTVVDGRCSCNVDTYIALYDARFYQDEIEAAAAAAAERKD